MIEVRKIGDYNALVCFDKSENQYTIAFKGEGGAIISGENLEEAEKKFIEAMQLTEVAAVLFKAVDAQEKALEAHKMEFESTLKDIEWASKCGKYHHEGDGHLSDYTIKELEKLGYKAKNFEDTNMNDMGLGFRHLPTEPYSDDMHIIEWEKESKMDDKKEYVTAPSNDKDDSGTLRHFRY